MLTPLAPLVAVGVNCFTDVRFHVGVCIRVTLITVISAQIFLGMTCMFYDSYVLCAVTLTLTLKGRL